MSLRIFLFVWILISIFQSEGPVQAASCCARSPAAPFLIVGDDLAQMNLGVSTTFFVGQADSLGNVQSLADGSSDRIWNYRMEGAILLSDLWQAGVSLPWVTRSITAPGVSDSSTRLGDVRLSLGYEFLPAWSYSKWKPQGFLFSVASFPTGRSMYEFQRPSLADVSGNGFFAFSAGALLIKRWAQWDAFVLGEGHYSLSRSFADGLTNYSVYPGFGASLGGGLGWSPGGGRVRLGARFHPRWDQLETVVYSGDTYVSAGSRWITDVGFDCAFLLAPTDTLLASFTDQTLFGPSRSAPLNRSVVLSYQHRWER